MTPPATSLSGLVTRIKILSKLNIAEKRLPQDGRVKNLETQSLNIAKENRRYIKEVVMPSYNISDGWKNPYYEDWLKSGGWKD